MVYASAIPVKARRDDHQWHERPNSQLGLVKSAHCVAKTPRKPKPHTASCEMPSEVPRRYPNRTTARFLRKAFVELATHITLLTACSSCLETGILERRESGRGLSGQSRYAWNLEGVCFEPCSMDVPPPTGRDESCPFGIAPVAFPPSVSRTELPESCVSSVPRAGAPLFRALRSPTSFCCILGSKRSVIPNSRLPKHDSRTCVLSRHL